MKLLGRSEIDRPRGTYVDLCRAYIEAALPRLGRPRQSISGLERAVDGHAYACWQLGIVDARESFSDTFSAWIAARAAVGTAAGWAVAMEVVARKTSRPAFALFTELCSEFLAGWGATSDTTSRADPLAGADYRISTAKLTKAVIRRPRMHYGRLSELADRLRGHAAAFEQLGLLKHDERFERKFAAWLKRERGANVRRGWVRAIKGLAGASGQTVDATFAECATAFLEDWLAEPPPVPMPAPAP